MHRRANDRDQTKASAWPAPSWRAIAYANAKHLRLVIPNNEDRLCGLEHQKVGLLSGAHSVAMPNAINVAAHQLTLTLRILMIRPSALHLWQKASRMFRAALSTESSKSTCNPYTFDVYSHMISEYNKLAPGKTTQIYRCGAEDLPWDSIENVDCAFTSPPYFSTEKYNEGGQFEEDQSWAKFNEYEKWRDEFYLPVALNSFNSLSENGFLMTNIMDPKIKGTRYRSCDDLVDHLQPHFLGQIGMRIMQRPQGKNKFKTKEELVEFMNKLYIENVWCFGKDKVFDLFRHKRRATLEGLFQ